MKIEWNLRVMMAHANIRPATQLACLLREQGVLISNGQMSRIVNTMPERINTKMIGALTDVLGCSINDIIQVTHE